jgi:hypothetical protein
MAMTKEELQNYKSLTIVRAGTSAVAALQYSVTEHTYVAMMPATGTVGTVQAEQIKLTDEKIALIVIEQDGTIRLDL